jgi:hypothetical protein
VLDDPEVESAWINGVITALRHLLVVDSGRSTRVVGSKRR